VLQEHQDFFQSMAGAMNPVQVESQAQGRVLIDPGHLQRVILNLVLNARDASEVGKPIHIRIENVGETEASSRTREYIRISVKDEGNGIDPSVLPHIFEPFYTTKPRGIGTGVGLAAVHQMVGHAGGHIRVETEVGIGSCFHVYLPRVSSA
jgi:signal transduction histidine kinase